jgi:TnpA family transposase
LGNDRQTRTGGAKRLTIFTAAERLALYSVPDFDDFQRAEFLAFIDAELALADRRRGSVERLHCFLQLGYFKAKHAFFDLTTDTVPAEDIAFLAERYFSDLPASALTLRVLRRRERDAQRAEIARLFGFRLWSGADRPALVEAATELARRDMTPSFIGLELLAVLRDRKIVRPGYTTLQSMISTALTVERKRLNHLVETALDAQTVKALRDLLARTETLPELAALAELKKDARNFHYKMMTAERQKRATLAPLYQAAKALLPTLGISQHNISRYADLALSYTIYDLRRMRPAQAHLYLLCYAWQRFRQLSDNLVDAFDHHLSKIEDETKTNSMDAFVQAQAKRQQEAPRVGRVLLLYVDEAVDDATPFGAVRKRAFAILPREALLSAGQRLCGEPVSQMELRWNEIDRAAARIKKNLRPLVMALDISAVSPANPWRAALSWMRAVFAREQSLGQRPIAEIPADTIPNRLRRHLYELDPAGAPVRLRGDRYEFWIYRQLAKRLATGELAVDDSLRHRRFGDELVPPEKTAAILQTLTIPWVTNSAGVRIDELCAALDQEWESFDQVLRDGQLTHITFDPERKSLTWRRPKAEPADGIQDGFYDKLTAQPIVDVFRFVDQACGFLSALTPLQPRYAKKVADEAELTAVIMARAMGFGNFGLAQACDIPYHVLEATDRQHIRPATLRDSCDRISNFIAGLPIFPLYAIDPEILYGAVDGQKFAAAHPTIKARYSRKYFGTGTGIVGYSLLANHVPLETLLIGANEHESQYLFDICYRNSTEIRPTVITGDMHSVNKANFAILDWFGMQAAPRFTSLQAQLPHLFCTGDISRYAGFLLPPAGQIDRRLIAAELGTIDRIVATLALKETSQATLVHKLCSLSSQNRTRKAIFEYDKLVRSLYTLEYIRSPKLQRDIHRSQNRIEAYHQLRAAIAQVAGRKELIGRTELDIFLTNQCGRLLALVIIAYNSILLSAVLDRHRAASDEAAITRLQKISPVAWQSILFPGRHLFHGPRQPIDLDAVLATANPL